MKRKILFFIKNLGSGGISHSLLHILNSLDFENFTITLFILNNNPNLFLLEKINKNIKIKFLSSKKNSSFLDKLDEKINGGGRQISF